MVGKLFAKLEDGKLGKDLQSNLPGLFKGHAGQLVPNDDSEYSQPRAFEHGIAAVVTPDVRLRFVRVGGQFSIDIAAPNGSKKWESLGSALSAKTNRGAGVWSYGDDPGSLDWSSIDRFLAENWERIRAALL